MVKIAPEAGFFGGKNAPQAKFIKKKCILFV